MSTSLYNELEEGPFVIAGPCVVESLDIMTEIAEVLVSLKAKYNIPIIFKASFDKANRTSIDSYRGPGLEKGLELLSIIKHKYKIPVTTDIHESNQAELLAEVVDVIQIPAFLARQTDLLLAAGRTNKIVNIKKGQFLSGEDMRFPSEKVQSTGNDKILLTERGNMYGYNNLIVDFRNIPVMQKHGFPVVMDCTHAVQRPGNSNGQTGGDRKYIPAMSYAAKAFGANGYFFEVHPSPEEALSDGPNTLYLKELKNVLDVLLN